MSLYDEKTWYQSKAVWGGVVAVVAAVAGYFGLPLGEADQAALVDAALAVAGAVGGILAIYGRVTAEKQVR